jgi:hypothetical protein
MHINHSLLPSGTNRAETNIEIREEVADSKDKAETRAEPRSGSFKMSTIRTQVPYRHEYELSPELERLVLPTSNNSTQYKFTFQLTIFSQLL